MTDPIDYSETPEPIPPEGFEPAPCDRTEDGVPSPPSRRDRGLVIALAGVAVAAVFFAAYAYAAGNAPGVVASGGMAECSSASAACGAGTAEAGECGGATTAADSSCTDCGGAEAAWTEPPTGRAVIDGGVQRIAVDVTDGYFDPTIVELAAGIPSQLVFSEGQGCLAEVSFPQFGIERDLTSGGATVEIPALQAGEYPFSCGMEMVYGVLVVR
jgi:hypothetical protein